MKAKPFATEADLCTAFIAVIPKGWTAYAETGGWDILLVHDDGTQLGIEAKLTLNAVVLAQACDGLTGYWTREAPDYRAVLVPAGKAVAGVGVLAGILGITIINLRTTSAGFGRQAFAPLLPDPKASNEGNWKPFWPERRHALPSIVPDVSAGTAAPVQLTEWKIKALKIMALLERHGAVSRADFRHLRIDASRWTQFWLRGTPAGYAICDATPRFDRQHPKAYAEVVATMAEWAPRALLPDAGTAVVANGAAA